MVYRRSIAIGVLFLVLSGLLSALIFRLSLGPCPTGTFSCDRGLLCVSQRQICDHRQDCVDGSDEHPVECGLLYGSKDMTNKIVTNAIKQKHRIPVTTNLTADPFWHNNSKIQGKVLSPIGKNANRLIVKKMCKPESNNNGLSNNKADTLSNNCEISTYPEACVCRQHTLLYCGPNSNLTHIPMSGDKITNLIIMQNNLTLQQNAFSSYKNLRRLKLKYNNLTDIPLGLFHRLQALERLDIRHNSIAQLPKGIFRGLQAVQWLFLSSNGLKRIPINEMAIELPLLEWLVLSDNLLTLDNERFPRLNLLLELNLNDNLITYIHPKAFYGLHNIRDIRLVGNPLKYLSSHTFLSNQYLEALSLGYTPLQIHSSLLRHLNVSYLNLTGIPFGSIDFESINVMTNLKYIIYDRFYYCSMTPYVRMCRPISDGLSTFHDLLSKPVLRYSVWIMAFITITGNIMVLWGRFTYRDENVAVAMVIRNLAFADLLMGFYLLTIGILDYSYRDEYHRVALDWITSWQCVAVGILAVSSSEVSLLILAFMSLERFLLIADPFRSHHRISSKTILITLIIIWIMGIVLAVAPVILWQSSTKYYGTYSGICFPLHIQEPYPLGWQYSAFLFLGINLSLLLIITLLYIALLVSIWRTRKATPLALLEYELAVKFFFIVLADILCWAPIIAMKIWVFFNYNISNDIYAWLVVFVLPLNSAINPLLYTFTTPKYRNQILSHNWKNIISRRREKSSRDTNTATGSSNLESYTLFEAKPCPAAALK
ncbi:leucine-rich repeat-containing G protein-coupled receptor 3 isoform 2-T2 [Glossina fuscipes fuscipes]